MESRENPGPQHIGIIKALFRGCHSFGAGVASDAPVQRPTMSVSMAALSSFVQLRAAQHVQILSGIVAGDPPGLNFNILVRSVSVRACLKPLVASLSRLTPSRNVPARPRVAAGEIAFRR